MKRTHRKKELTEVQELRLENKNLRGQVRDLKKQVRQLQKQEHFHENTRLDEEADQMMFDIEPTQPKCPECNKGELVFVNVVGRTWSECSQCDYRTKTIKIGLKNE